MGAYLGFYQGLPASVAQALSFGEDRPLSIACQEIHESTDKFLGVPQRYSSARTHTIRQSLFEAPLMVARLGSQIMVERQGRDEVWGDLPPRILDLTGRGTLLVRPAGPRRGQSGYV